MPKCIETLKPHRKKASDKGDTVTHVNTQGNVLNYTYPSDETAHLALVQSLSKDVENAAEFYLHEYPSSVFRMFFDVDLLHTERLTSAEIDEFLQAVYVSIARFYPPSITVATPAFFEAIVLDAPPQKLVRDREQLRELSQRIAYFDGKQNITARGGRVARANETTFVAVEWLTDPAPDGSYQCAVESDLVFLITGNAPRFRNPQVRKPELESALRTGPAPPAKSTLRMSDECERIGKLDVEWSTVFVVDDCLHFVNSQRDEQGYVKHDMHIHFPMCHVTIEQALFMRSGLIEHLTQKFGTRFAPHGWPAALNNLAYGSAVPGNRQQLGLRMIGAHKAVHCSQCYRKKKRERDEEVCDICHGALRVSDDERKYVFASVYVNGQRDYARQSSYEKHTEKLVRATMIRTCRSDPDPQWKRYDGCPQFGEMLETLQRPEQSIVRKLNGDVPSFRKTQGKIPGVNVKSVVEVTDRTVWEILQKHLRTRFLPKMYGRLRVNRVRMKATDEPRDRIYFIDVEGEGQHWCSNLRPPSDHENSTIYFQATRDSRGKFGMCVRCRCPDPTVQGRHQGACRGFHSVYKEFSTCDRDALFT